MKVLFIGNSYSQDSTRYIHQLAAANGENVKAVCPYIGGCTLAMHYANMNNNDYAYRLIYNGKDTGFKVSLKQCLQSDEWDVVIIQQASAPSADPDSFEPYLSHLIDYVKLHAPKAELAIMQTWFYTDSAATMKRAGIESPEKMFEAVKASCSEVARREGIKMIFPAGQALMNLKNNGIERVHRDEIHASYGIGRYTLALTLYELLLKKQPLTDLSAELEEPISQADLQTAHKSAHDAVLSVI